MNELLFVISFLCSDATTYPETVSCANYAIICMDIVSKTDIDKDKRYETCKNLIEVKLNE